MKKENSKVSWQHDLTRRSKDGHKQRLCHTTDLRSPQPRRVQYNTIQYSPSPQLVIHHHPPTTTHHPPPPATSPSPPFDFDFEFKVDSTLTDCSVFTSNFLQPNVSFIAELGSPIHNLKNQSAANHSLLVELPRSIGQLSAIHTGLHRKAPASYRTAYAHPQLASSGRRKETVTF